MAYFRYEAIDRLGSKITGNIDAQTSGQAVKLLREKELFVLKVQGRSELTTRAVDEAESRLLPSGRYRLPSKQGLSKDIQLFKPTPKQWAQVYRQLALMIRSGVTLVEALETVARRALHPRIQMILFDVLERVENGESLAGAMSNYEREFGHSTIQLIRCGEHSGDMEQVLSDIVVMIAYRVEQQKKVKSALLIPKAISAAVIVLFFVVSYKLAPQFRSVLGDDLRGMPLITTSLFTFTDFFRASWPYLFVGGVGLGFGLRRWHQSEQGKNLLDATLLRMPLFGQIIVHTEMNRTFHTINLLLRSGLPLIDALKAVTQVSTNQYFVNLYSLGCERLLSGESFADSLVHVRVPELVPVLVAVGERTGALEEVTAELSAYFRQELEDSVKALIDRLPIFLTVVIGGIVGWVYGGVMLGLASTRF